MQCNMTYCSPKLFIQRITVYRVPGSPSRIGEPNAQKHVAIRAAVAPLVYDWCRREAPADRLNRLGLSLTYGRSEWPTAVDPPRTRAQH